MSKAVTWINLIINRACVSYGFPHLIKNGYDLLFCCVFVNFFNFAFNFDMLHSLATAYRFVPQIVTNTDQTVAG